MDVVENNGRECVPETHIVLQVVHVAVVAVADGQPLARAPADGADLAEARGAGRVPGQARAAGGVKGSRCVERQDDRGRAEIFRGFARRCCGGQAAEGGEKREGAVLPHLARAAKMIPLAVGTGTSWYRRYLRYRCVPTVAYLRYNRERNPLALPTLDMYLPLSKFE